MKNIIMMLTALMLTSCAGMKKHEYKSEKQVKKVVVSMVNAIDTKEWNTAIEQFDEKVFVDYESLSGQKGSVVPAKGLVGNWEKLLAKVDTHHMLTNFDIKVDGDRAEMFSHVYASHTAKGIKYWDAYGRYHHKLKRTKNGWKITFMKLIMHGQKGNKKFLQQASK